MSDALKYGGPAFPTEPRGPAYGNKYDGMTLRDWFAGQALMGMMASRNPNSPIFSPDADACFVYEIADAMLAKRQVVQPPRYLTVAAQEDRG